METSTAEGALVVLAWLDSTVAHDATLVAFADGRQTPAESALARLFPGGTAGAARVIPWLERGLRPDPMCAYAAIRAGSVRSGFVLSPGAHDIARLDSEFRTVTRDLVGVHVAHGVDTIRRTPATNDRIEINIFEGAAFRDGAEIALSDGEFAIAAAMALDRRALSREEWCDTLWPERDAESAARLLKVYVHRIRTKFGTNRIVDTHGSGYRVGLDVRVDIHSLESLARKRNAGHVRLEASQLRNVQRAFDGFMDRRYRRLATLDRYEGLERRVIATGVEIGRILVHEALADGDGARALQIAEHLVAIDPYDDVAAELLIRVQLGLGRDDAASRHFRTFCRTLHDELDLPPPQHLARLLQV